MKQILLRNRHDLAIQETPPPACPPQGVVISMRAAAICRTDIKIFRKGHRDLVLPRIPGHEGVGEIVQSDHAHYATGTLVALYPGVFCQKCDACLAGQTGRCHDLHIRGFDTDGFFRTMLPIETELLQTLVPIPQDKDPQCVVLAEPLACCINALNKFKQLRYNVALVVGAGAVGCLFAALLHAEGFQNVFIADRNPARLEQGVPLHVSTLHVADRPLQAYLKDAGIDGRIDFLAAACEEGLAWPYWEAMNTGGCVSIFSGQATGNALLPIHMNVVHYRELMLAGTYGCNLIDFHSAVRMLVTGSLNLHFLQPHCLPLQAIHTGIAMLEKHQTKKVIFSEF